MSDTSGAYTISSDSMFLLPTAEFGNLAFGLPHLTRPRHSNGIRNAIYPPVRFILAFRQTFSI